MLRGKLKKAVLVSALSSVLAISGCGGGDKKDSPAAENTGNETASASEKELGRFVEENIAFPRNLDFVYGAYSKGSDLVFFSREYSEDGRVIFNRNVISETGETVSTEFAPLSKLEAEGYMPRNVSESPNGTVAAYGYYPSEEATAGEVYIGGDERRFAGISVDGGDFQLFELSPEDVQLYPFSILAYDGGYIVQFMMNFARQYDLNGNFIREYSGGYSEKQTAIYGNNLAIVDTTGDSITVYDITTGNALYTAPFGDTQIVADALDYNSNIFLGIDEKGVFAAASSGIYRYDGSAWGMDVPGNLTSLVIPDMRLSGLASNGSEYFAVLGMPSSIMKYVYDPSAPKEPDTVLEIFSLYDNSTVRKAVGEFRRNNPDAAVDLRVAMDGADGATAEDVIRALNTEILAGNGPDLMILDGLPVESYIEKGVLKDITALSNELKAEGLMESMAKSLEQDGKVYGIPSRFSFPIMLGDMAAISTLTSPAVLAEEMALHQTETPALLKAPDELYVRPEPSVIMDYYDIAQDNFLTGKTIDEAALADFYKNTLAIDTSLKATTPEDQEVFYYSIGSAGGVSENIDMGMLGVSDGRAKVYHQTLNSLYLLSNLANEFSDMDGMGIASMFGWNKFYPTGSIGVLASGENLELSEEFVSAMLSREVQDVYLSDGFPVNSNAVQAMLDETPSYSIDENGELVETPIDMGFAELVAGLSEPVFVNSVIKEAVNGQIEGLLAGTVTPEQAAANVVNDTKIYLSE